MPTVSVIIPTYNRAALLKIAVQSVLAQTHRDCELIVVDDGSTDDTENQMREFNDPRVRFVKQSNAGVSAARNHGLKIAMGDFVAFLDADDFWDNQFLEKMLEHLMRKNYDWVICDNYRIVLGPNDREVKREYRKRFYTESVRDFYKDMIQRDTIGGPSRALLKRDILLSIDGFDENLEIREDWDLWIRLLAAGYKVGYVAKPMYTYFIRNDSLTKTKRHAGINATIYLLKKHVSEALAVSSSNRQKYSEIYLDLAREALFELKSYNLFLKCLLPSLALDFNLLKYFKVLAAMLKRWMCRADKGRDVVEV